MRQPTETRGQSAGRELSQLVGQLANRCPKFKLGPAKKTSLTLVTTRTSTKQESLQHRPQRSYVDEYPGKYTIPAFFAMILNNK